MFRSYYSSIRDWTIPEKSKQGGGVVVENIEFEFPGVSVEERACGNSRGQLKKKWNFRRVGDKLEKS